MKQLLLMLILALSYSVVKAQLNQSQGQVKQLMSNDNGWSFERSGHDKHGWPTLSYQSKEKNWTKTFYFKNDSCASIKLIIPYAQLGDFIKDMNRKFITIDKNVWFDDKEKITYAVVEADNPLFFEVYELHLSSSIISQKLNSD